MPSRRYSLPATQARRMSVRGLQRLASTLSDSFSRFSSKDYSSHRQFHEIEEDKRFFIKKVRWQISLMASLGFLIAFGMRSNLGIAKTRMLKNFTDVDGVVHPPEFNWTTSEIGTLETSFYYGYAFSQIPAGMLAAKFAPNRLLGFGVMIAGFLSIFTAITLHFHPFTDICVILCQVLQGVFLGVIYPAMHGVWRYWAPPMDRSKLATTTFTGAYFGVLVGLPVTTYLVFHFDWSTPFYVFGSLGIIWSIVWFQMSAKCPETHPYISKNEKDFIMDRVGVVTTSHMTLSTIPWCKILKSPAVWAIIVCNFTRSWTFFMLLGNLVTFLKDVYDFDISTAGLLTAFPQLALIITVLLSGQAADYLRSSGRMNTEAVRKLFNTIGFGGEALLISAVAFTSSPVIGITLLTIGTGFGGICISGFNVNHFDIAPRYSPILMGFSNGLGAFAGASSYITNWLTPNNPIGWRYCFLIAAAVEVFGILFFLVFAKGEIQDWAKEKEPEISTQEIVRRISTVVRKATRLSMRKTSSETEAHDERFGFSMDSGLAHLRNRQVQSLDPNVLPSPTSLVSPDRPSAERQLRRLHRIENLAFSSTLGSLSGISEVDSKSYTPPPSPQYSFPSTPVTEDPSSLSSFDQQH